jgi:preprotein translocase subunit SecD
VSLRARAILVCSFLLLIGFFAVNDFVPEETRTASAILPDQGLRLGLDLRGGIHWVIGVKLEKAIEQELEFLKGSLEERLEEEKVFGPTFRVEDGRLTLTGASESELETVMGLVDDTEVLTEVDRTGTAVSWEITSQWQREVRERAMEQVLEVLRNRVSDPAKGIAESVVTRQGNDRVLVQIPGGEVDRERARDILEVTGLLEFKIVRDQAASEALLRDKYPGGLPENTVIAFEKDSETGREIVAYLVDAQPGITGKYLADARVGFDPRQRPIVRFRWTPEGGEIFGELTEANKEKQLAIILDDEVRSAPVIRSRISMSGQIEGRFTTEEASDLAIVLRAGSLSVPVVIEEERTVGPALGADSIRRGLNASIAGLILVVIFTALYYRRAGLFASVALAVNLVLIIGLMSLPELPATLTLPGIAGLVLTVGMAIDANVIIFERVREELRAGKLPRAAVETGFNKARWTILDANITTLMTALVLYEYGTGPIKGFAVTLSIGILTSVFTALVVTRLLFDFQLRGEHRLDALSI